MLAFDLKRLPGQDNHVKCDVDVRYEDLDRSLNEVLLNPLPAVERIINSDDGEKKVVVRKDFGTVGTVFLVLFMLCSMLLTTMLVGTSTWFARFARRRGGGPGGGTAAQIYYYSHAIRRKLRSRAVRLLTGLQAYRTPRYTRELFKQHLLHNATSTDRWEVQEEATDAEREVVADQHSFVAAISTLDACDVELAPDSLRTYENILDKYLSVEPTHKVIVQEHAAALIAESFAQPTEALTSPESAYTSVDELLARDEFLPEHTDWPNLKTCSFDDVMSFEEGVPGRDFTEVQRAYYRDLLKLQVVYSHVGDTVFDSFLQKYTGPMYPSLKEAIHKHKLALKQKFESQKMSILDKTAYAVSLAFTAFMVVQMCIGVKHLYT